MSIYFIIGLDASMTVFVSVSVSVGIYMYVSVYLRSSLCSRLRPALLTGCFPTNDFLAFIFAHLFLLFY